jgi:hypothetical protein
MVIKKFSSKKWADTKIPISWADTKIPVSYPKTKIPVSYPKIPGINEKSSDSEESQRIDPALHYEVNNGQFGNNLRQSLTYRGKKTRWR